jgi:asparagine synthase (glutamine-hydrolysing)
VAATLSYPDHPDADERLWQDRAVRHLGAREWVRLEVGDELDLVGPLAAAQLRRHGLRFPANAHSLTPLAELAAGGTLVTGIGGDQLLMGNRWTRVNAVLARRRRPRPRDMRRLALAAMPPPARRRLQRRRDPGPGDLPWLTPHGNRAWRRRVLEARSDPVRFDRVVREAVAGRGLQLTVDTVGAIAREAGAEAAAPLLDLHFVAALCRAGGRRGFGGRSAAMRAIAGGRLPDELLTRSSKAVFNAVFFGEPTRAFAAGWSGGGVDPEIVEAGALRAEWLSETPDFRSALLLQSAWLHDRARVPITPAAVGA